MDRFVKLPRLKQRRCNVQDKKLARISAAIEVR